MNLDKFLTTDEYLWLSRSRNFIVALSQHDWANTFQTGHPGVTTMWSGSLGLWWYGFEHGLIQNGTFFPFLKSLDWNNWPIDLIPYLRWPIIVITILGLGGIYWLSSLLFNKHVALIGVLLIALNPWYLAHSRFLHHDALMTTFMTLSALALLLHVWRGPSRGALLVSAVCAGLALLSKTLSLFLIPWAGLLFLIAWQGQRWRWLQVAVDGTIWGLTTWLTFFLLWPAMWLNPTDTLWRMRQMVETYALNPHEKGQFFMGQPIPDPGAFFYPVVLLFALTPLVMIGLTACGWGRLPKIFRRSWLQDLWTGQTGWVLLLGVYSLAYLVFISLGEKKQERYLLPALVMLNLIAAIGLVRLGDYLEEKYHRKINFKAALPLAVLLVQAATVLPYQPHYLTYYNPLLGGSKLAGDWLLVGWGEGNELAAQYLNNLPGAEKLKVVSSQPTTFAPFFRGETKLWWPESQMLTADYLVLYRRQAQQGQPDFDILRYINQKWPLETTIELNGLIYAWIYRVPTADWAANLEDERLTDRTGLLGYRLTPKNLSAGQTLTMTLYYRPRPISDEHWQVALNGPDGQQWPMTCQTGPDCGALANTDSIAEEYYAFSTPHLLPGNYQVQIGLQSAGNKVKWLTVDDLVLPEVHILAQ